MKHQQRFCCECNKETDVMIKEYKTFAMYHCRECGAEVCRVGDSNSPKHNRKTIPGGIDRNASADFADDPRFVGLSYALHSPDVLSDEHRFWEPRDEEAEFQKQQKINAFKVAFEKLTFRQKQVAAAVEMYETHEAAAKSLGVSRTLVTSTMKIVQKKLNKHMSKYTNR